MPNQEEKKYYRQKYCYFASTILFGTSSIITATYLDRMNFRYALFQTVIMFLGQFLAYFVFLYLNIRKDKAIGDSDISVLRIFGRNRTQRIGKKVFCLAGLFDFIDCFLEYSSYNLLQPSGIMALEFLLVFNMFIYRIVILKRQIFRHQFLGLFLVMIGMIFVSLVLFLKIDGGHTAYGHDALLAVVFMVIAQFFNMLGYICVEHFMNNIEITAEEVISIKGITGIFLCLISYVPLHFIYSTDTKDNTLSEPFIFIKDNLQLIPFLILFMLISCFFNLF